MNDQSKSKNTEQEDLELIRRSSHRHTAPLNMLTTNPEVKRKIESEQKKTLIDNQLKLFEQGYQVLIAC